MKHIEMYTHGNYMLFVLNDSLVSWTEIETTDIYEAMKNVNIYIFHQYNTECDFAIKGSSYDTSKKECFYNVEILDDYGGLHQFDVRGHGCADALGNALSECICNDVAVYDCESISVVEWGDKEYLVNHLTDSIFQIITEYATKTHNGKMNIMADYNRIVEYAETLASQIMDDYEIRITD